MMQAGCRQRRTWSAFTGVAAALIATAAAPAAASAHNLVGSVATAPPGYVVARSAPFAAPNSPLISGGQERCPTGTVVWGGGVSFFGTVGAGEAIGTSEPLGSGGWEGQVGNTTGGPQNFRVDAFCAKKPKGYKLVLKTVGDPAHGQSHATAVCPANTVLLSGGMLSTSESAAVFFTSAFPVGQTKFRAFMWNGTTADENLTAFALCGHKPAGYAIVSHTVTSLPHGDLDSGAGCPAKTSILGGGVNISNPEPGIPVPRFIDGSNTGWDASVVNTTPISQTMTSYAICAA